jgi:hypothetical protein
MQPFLAMIWLKICLFTHWTEGSTSIFASSSIQFSQTTDRSANCAFLNILYDCVLFGNSTWLFGSIMLSDLLKFQISSTLQEPVQNSANLS